MKKYSIDQNRAVRSVKNAGFWTLVIFLIDFIYAVYALIAFGEFDFLVWDGIFATTAFYLLTFVLFTLYNYFLHFCDSKQ